MLRYRLEKNYRAILRDLEPGKVLPYLFQEGIFDLDDKDEVNAEKTRKKKAEVLLDKLQREGPRALEVLVSALRQKQPHLAGILETPVPGETGNFFIFNQSDVMSKSVEALVCFGHEIFILHCENNRIPELFCATRTTLVFFFFLRR